MATKVLSGIKTKTISSGSASKSQKYATNARRSTMKQPTSGQTFSSRPVAIKPMKTGITAKATRKSAPKMKMKATRTTKPYAKTPNIKYKKSKSIRKRKNTNYGL